MEIGIARLSTAISGAKIGTEISMKVMKLALEQMEEVGRLINSLGEAAIQDPAIGQTLDVSL